MKLGKLLVKGFRRSKRRKPDSASKKIGKKRGAKATLFPGKSARGFKARSKKRAPSLLRAVQEVVSASNAAPIEAQVQEAALKTQVVAPQVPAVQPAPKPLVPVVAAAQSQSSAGTSLTTQDLVRPGDSLRQSIEGFLLDQRSPHTRRAYAKDLKRFVQFLLLRKIDRGIEGLDRSILIAYKDSLLGEGLEHTTIDRHLATLRSFFRWLVDDGMLPKSPAEGVRFLNPKRLSRTIGFSDEEVRKLLALPNLHTRTGAQHYAILTILFYCGLRRSEVCGLRTTSLGKERGHAVIRLKGKGNAERVIVLVPRVVQALDHYFRITAKDRNVDQPLFNPIRNNRGGVTDKPLDPSMIFYIVTRYAKLAGVANRVSPHSCRATAISNARDHHVPDRAIQEFAGWASPDMITRYDKRKTAVEGSAAHAIRYGAEDRHIPGISHSEAAGESVLPETSDLSDPPENLPKP